MTVKAWSRAARSAGTIRSCQNEVDCVRISWRQKAFAHALAHLCNRSQSQVSMSLDWQVRPFFPLLSHSQVCRHLIANSVQRASRLGDFSSVDIHTEGGNHMKHQTDLTHTVYYFVPHPHPLLSLSHSLSLKLQHVHIRFPFPSLSLSLSILSSESSLTLRHSSSLERGPPRKRRSNQGRILDGWDWKNAHHGNLTDAAVSKRVGSSIMRPRSIPKLIFPFPSHPRWIPFLHFQALFFFFFRPSGGCPNEASPKRKNGENALFGSMLRPMVWEQRSRIHTRRFH
jgi:hypothetical protein